MPMITLPAHYDGKQICLDEAFELLPDTKLFVTIISKSEPENDYKDWLSLSGTRLTDAYGEDEPEYSLNMLREENMKYE